MGRPRKGERPKGRFKNCSGCGKSVYRAPSQLRYKRVICSKQCHKTLSFHFPCAVCKAPVYTQPAQLKLRARSTCSPKCRRELRQIKAQKNRIENGFTKHQIDRILRYSAEAKEWRRAVFERDNYTCQMCGIRGSYLEADHIKPWAYFPKLRFELTNGRTLCRNCHDTTKISYKEMRKIYDQERTKNSH